MRENRTYGSEGGEAANLPYPYQVGLTAGQQQTQKSKSPGEGFSPGD